MSDVGDVYCADSHRDPDRPSPCRNSSIQTSCCHQIQLQRDPAKETLESHEKQPNRRGCGSAVGCQGCHDRRRVKEANIRRYHCGVRNFEPMSIDGSSVWNRTSEVTAGAKTWPLTSLCKHDQLATCKGLRTQLLSVEPAHRQTLRRHGSPSSSAVEMRRRGEAEGCQTRYYEGRLHDRWRADDGLRDETDRSYAEILARND